HDVDDLAAGHVAGNQVPVLGVLLLEEVPTLVLRDGARVALVVLVLRHPDAAAFAAGGFAHQPVLVVPGNGGGMHLDELGIRVDGAVDVRARRGGAGVDGRVRAASVDDAGST